MPSESYKIAKIYFYFFITQDIYLHTFIIFHVSIVLKFCEKIHIFVIMCQEILFNTMDLPIKHLEFESLTHGWKLQK